MNGHQWRLVSYIILRFTNEEWSPMQMLALVRMGKKACDQLQVWLIGMTNTNQPFVAIVASVVWFQARPNMLTQVPISPDRAADNDNDRWTNWFLYSLRMCVEKILCTIYLRQGLLDRWWDASFTTIALIQFKILILILGFWNYNYICTPHC